MSQSPVVFDVGSADFDRYVLENSFHKPVLVDFWADWCAPCKALMPVLAKITEGYRGKLLLAKVNCDQHPELTQRFGIRSLPTVVLFKDGQPVDGFMGAQPEAAIRELLKPHVAEPPAEEETVDLQGQALALLEAGQAEAAIALLQPALVQQPEDALLLLLARALAHNGQLEEAEQVLGTLQSADAHKAAVSAVRAQLAVLRQLVDVPPRAALIERLQASPHDSQALYQLALRDLAEQRHEPALGGLLALFQHDRGYREGIAHKTLLQVFDLLGSEHPLTIAYRRKLYQILY